MYKFETLLKQNKFAPEGPSTSVKRQIKEFRKLQGDIAEAQNDLPNIKSESKKKDIEEEIREATLELDKMDEEIVHSINKYIKNKDTYAANANRLKNSRNGNQSAAASTAAAQSAGTPAAGTPSSSTPQPAEGSTPPAPSGTPDPSSSKPAEKKSSGVFGWVLGGLGLLAAIVIGKNILEK